MDKPMKAAATVLMGMVATAAGATESPVSVTDPAQLSQRLLAHLVQDFHAAFGDHHARAVHTKGVILEGHLRAPDPAADGDKQGSRLRGARADHRAVLEFHWHPGHP